MKKILVLGGAGYLGSVIVEKVLDRGDEPIVFSLQSSEFLKEKRVRTVIGDVRDKQALSEAFVRLGSGGDVIHAASIITIQSRPDKILEEVNVGGTANILEMCARYDIRRLVYISSVHALPITERGYVKSEASFFDPSLVSGQYAKSKAKASALVVREMQKGRDIIMIHPSGIVGPSPAGGGQIEPMLRSYIEGSLPASIAGGYDFVDVRDVADGILNALDKGRAGQSYILSGEYYQAKDILDLASDLTGRRKLRNIIPMDLFKIVAPVVEWGADLFKKAPPLTAYMARTLDSFEIYSHRKASKELNYHPRPVKDSVRDVLQVIAPDALQRS